MAIDVRRAGERFHTEIDWLDSWHSFSFGRHYDPDEHPPRAPAREQRRRDPRRRAGFGTHSHRDMEIVTWVLDGELEHRDSTGTVGVIYPGLAQRMSAGSRHHALGDERERDRRRPPRADVGARPTPRASSPATSSTT